MKENSTQLLTTRFMVTLFFQNKSIENTEDFHYYEYVKMAWNKRVLFRK